ncbi:uncharacterized protein N7511_010928 [Penicillium nucicola]|uniref:uncharacterized protein n=1 Tax=Penicillium nucicola TaxID=1850975 RepID=UPI002544E29B|nr:uncharacterized protein N7511_010928 [Penicillium nucicola]KAJ5749232.1 hypothetical protein N7511_010928 [Penicillium nucicola]
MASLGQLPTEILQMIATQIYSQNDLLHLIYSSRKMCNLLLPILYSQVRLCDCHFDIQTVVPFLITILRYPELAKAVQHLDLNDWRYSPWDPRIQPRFDYEDHHKRLLKKADLGVRYSCEEEQLLFQGLEMGDSDAWLAVLIPQLTSLKSLRIAWPYEENKVNTMFAKAAEDGGRLFPHLQEVKAGHCDIEGYLDTDYLDPFFKFPAMRRVVGVMVAEDEEDNAPEPPSQRYSGVEKIELVMSNTVYGFPVWIQSCMALRSFHLDIGGPSISDVSIQSDPLRESLSYHKTTLETLWIRTDEEADRDEDEGWIGSFADFSALRMLQIPFKMLIDFDPETGTNQELRELLPPTLTFLYLCQCDPDLVVLAIEQIEALLDSRCLPKLVSLGLECSRPKKSIRPRMDLLTSRCKEMGIAFVNLPPSQRETWYYLGRNWPSHGYYS